MKRHPIPAIALTALAAISACGVLIPHPKGAPASSSSSKLSQKDREKLREVGGDQLVADYEFADAATGPDGHMLRSCVNYYVNATTTPPEERLKPLQAGNYKDCVRTCSDVATGRYSESKVAPGRYADIANRYLETCREKNDANKADRSLKDARYQMDGLRASGTPLSWYLNTVAARLSLDRAREILGPDNAELRQLFSDYDRLFAAHRKEIKAAQDFQERPDIADMLARARVLDQELPELRKRYESTHMDSTANLIRLKQQDREAIESRYHNEGVKAGVMKREGK